MDMKIGILGYGGYIGRNATEKLLRNNIKVLGGQRKESELFANDPNFTYRYVDVKDPENLRSFINECDIVVNSVSPSHIYGKIIKDAVTEAGKIYVDPSDASFEKDRENVKGKCVVSAGYIPGLSEFLPEVAAKRDFDKIERTVVYQGGFDGCSAGSFVDMIIGAGNENFAGDSYIEKGVLKPLSISINKMHKTPFSDEQVIFKPMITLDTGRLHKITEAEKSYFFCTYADRATLGFFMKLLMEVTKNDKETAAKNIEEKLNERIRTNEKFANQTPGAFLYIEIDGIKDNKRLNKAYKLYLTNVNKVCGYFLAETVLAVLQNPEILREGLNYGSELVPESYERVIPEEIGEEGYFRYEILSDEESVSIEKLQK